MFTVIQTYQTSYEVKNSQFVAILYPLANKESIPTLLDQVKKQYPAANHYCYAYRFNSEGHAWDDHEPSQTAGLPILNILEKNHLEQVLLVVVRYFGGIKLGAGGLIRAYSKAARLVVSEAQLHLLQEGYLVEMQVPYNEQKQIDFLLHSYTSPRKEYLEQVHYSFEITKEAFYKIQSQLSGCHIVEERMIVKKAS